MIDGIWMDEGELLSTDDYPEYPMSVYITGGTSGERENPDAG